MFEILCVFLLRLYPAEFRCLYGGDAAQLMRDRARDERGLTRRLRLLADLAVDLIATSVRGWPRARPSFAPIDGAPRFEIIDVRYARPETLAVALLASAVMFAAFTQLLQATALPNAPVGRQVEETRHGIVTAIADNLKQIYVDRAHGQQLADALLAHEKNGDYESLETGAALAARINTDIQTAARALGIPRGVFVADVVYSARALPTGPPPAMTDRMREQDRAAILQRNCLFETVEILPHQLGYLKLNGFANATACQETTARAMATLNDADALIVDLRDNGGGFGETALQIAGYLFARPTFMYDPRPHSLVPDRTASPVPGNTLVDKPVWILTSSRTQSAAEYFVYNLKMLKRATIVGETTAGHQHSGAFHRISEHFGMGIQDSPPPDNPYSVKGWEVIGIEPDVKVSRADAFDAARKLVESRARR